MEQANAAMKKGRWAWYWYDFGNSAYAAVVLLAVFSAYFKGTVVGGAEGSRLWGLAVGAAMLTVAVISPVLGTIADYSGSKKRFLLVFTSMSVVFTALLFFVEKGDVLMGVMFFILAEIGYRSSQVFYNALLPDIAAPDEMAKVSGNGWAIGSAGGIICLLIVLPINVIWPGALSARLSLVITAVFFAVSALPIFTQLTEKGERRALPDGESYLTLAFGRLLATFRRARDYREFIKFIVAFLIYNDGVIMALDFAAIIGAVLFGMDQQMLIIFVIVVQITNVAGAWLFGLMAERTDCKRALVVSLAMMFAVIVWMFYCRSMTEFFFVGAVAGFAMAGIQSVSRTFVSVITPEGQSAEFYGFFAVAGRTSSFIGPTIYGLLAASAANWYQNSGQDMVSAEMMGQRIAILSIGLFILVGGILLLSVSQRRAQEAAGRVNPRSSVDA